MPREHNPLQQAAVIILAEREPDAFREALDGKLEQRHVDALREYIDVAQALIDRRGKTIVTNGHIERRVQ